MCSTFFCTNLSPTSTSTCKIDKEQLTKSLIFTIIRLFWWRSQFSIVSQKIFCPSQRRNNFCYLFKFDAVSKVGTTLLSQNFFCLNPFHRHFLSCLSQLKILFWEQGWRSILWTLSKQQQLQFLFLIFRKSQEVQNQ